MTEKAATSDTRRASFIERADALHPGRYSYERVEYVNSRTAVEIICREHERAVVFTQTPKDHLKGNNCPECWGRKGSSREGRGEIFVRRASARHGGLYLYDPTSYVDAHSAVTIICRVHGEFRQRATKHLEGRGCPLCGQSR